MLSEAATQMRNGLAFGSEIWENIATLAADGTILVVRGDNET